MNLHDAEELARKLISVYELTGQQWTFKWDSANLRAGRTTFHSGNKVTIGLSQKIISLWSEHEVQDVILHEIAHALTGPAGGHGPDWRENCIKIGARPEKYHQGETPSPRWLGNCPCGTPHQRYRLTSIVRNKSYCTRCLSSIRWVKNPQY